MKETTVQIDGMMSIFDGAGVEKQIKRRDAVARVDANFLNGTASVVYDEARVSSGDINTFVADCGYHCRDISELHGNYLGATAWTYACHA